MMSSMEKVSYVKNGELRLPPGFRFHPTDEELVVQYLKRKVFSRPLPASIIPDLHLCNSNSDPWDLPGSDLEQERYFFRRKEAKYPNGKRCNRATKSGYWKATGLDKQIVTSKGNQVVGMKKTLVFYKGKPPHGSRTDWIMHEYRLLPIPTHHFPVENWVLCRIFFKTRGSGAKNINVHKIERNNSTVVFYDFLPHNNTDLNIIPASSSSSLSLSSGITHLSTNQSDEHEDTSSCTNTNTNTFPYCTTKP